MDPRWLALISAVSAWDSSDAMRLKYALPLEAGRDRMERPWGAFGFKGDETKWLEENERVGCCFDVGDSGGRRGDSKWEVVGVLAWECSSGLLEPLGMKSASS